MDGGEGERGGDTGEEESYEGGRRGGINGYANKLSYGRCLFPPLPNGAAERVMFSRPANQGRGKGKGGEEGERVTVPCIPPPPPPPHVRLTEYQSSASLPFETSFQSLSCSLSFGTDHPVGHACLSVHLFVHASACLSPNSSRHRYLFPRVLPLRDGPFSPLSFHRLSFPAGPKASWKRTEMWTGGKR